MRRAPRGPKGRIRQPIAVGAHQLQPRGNAVGRHAQKVDICSCPGQGHARFIRHFMFEQTVANVIAAVDERRIGIDLRLKAPAKGEIEGVDAQLVAVDLVVALPERRDGIAIDQTAEAEGVFRRVGDAERGCRGYGCPQRPACPDRSYKDRSAASGTGGTASLSPMSRVVFPHQHIADVGVNGDEWTAHRGARRRADVDHQLRNANCTTIGIDSHAVRSDLATRCAHRPRPPQSC